MKIDWNSKYNTIAVYACIIILCSITLIFSIVNFDFVISVITKIFDVLTPIFLGFAIAYLFYPMLKWFKSKVFGFLNKKNPRPKLVKFLSVLCTYLVFSLIIISLFLLIIPQVMTSYNDLQTNLDDYVTKAQIWLIHLTESVGTNENIPEFISNMIDTDKISEQLQNFTNDAYSLIKKAAPAIFGYLGNIVISVSNLIVGIIVSIYFLYSGERLTAQVKKLSRAAVNDKLYGYLSEFVNLTDRSFGGFIRGKLVDSLIIGILTFIVLQIFRIPYAPLISVIVGVTNIIPFFGPFIGAIPSAFIIFIADPLKSLWFILIILIIQQLDGNVIGPKILSESLGLSSLGVIIAVTVMGGLMGFAGMIIGVPLFAIVSELLSRFIRKRLKSKNLPSEVDDYIKN